MDDFQPSDEYRTDVFVVLEAGPWWVCVLILLIGVALLVARRRVRGRAGRIVMTALAVLLVSLGLAGTVLAVVGPVRLG